MRTFLFVMFGLCVISAGEARAATKCVILSADTTTVLYAVNCGETSNPTPASIDDSDARWIAFVAKGSAQLGADLRQPTYQARLNQGITITCAADSSINDTYAIDSDHQATLNGIYFSLKVGASFPNGSMSSFPYANASRTAAHVFSVAEFEALSDAVKSYIYDLSQWAGTGFGLPSATAALPSPPC